MPSGTLKESTDDQGAFVGLERSLAERACGVHMFNTSFLVTLPVVSKRKGKIFWKTNNGVDIECLWAHGYNTLKYTTLKHPYYTLSRIDEAFSWLFLIYPVILEGAWCIFLVNDELKNARLPQNHRVRYQTTPGPKRTLKPTPLSFRLQGISIQEADGRLWRLGTKTFWDFGGRLDGGFNSEIQETHAVSVQLSIRKHAHTHTHQKKGRYNQVGCAYNPFHWANLAKKYLPFVLKITSFSVTSIIIVILPRYSIYSDDHPTNRMCGYKK